MKRTMRFIISVAALTGLSFFIMPWIRNRIESASPPPNDLGIKDGQLKSCPDSPNCVSTYDSDDQHGIAPIPFEGTAEEAQEQIVAVLNGMDRITIITSEPGYIHAEIRSPRMTFIDDIEFQFGEGVEGIQFRSAARLGYGDGGANRRHMEVFRKRFAAQ